MSSPRGALAAEIPIHTKVQLFSMAETNQALLLLKQDGINGAAVVKGEEEE